MMARMPTVQYCSGQARTVGKVTNHTVNIDLNLYATSLQVSNGYDLYTINKAIYYLHGSWLLPWHDQPVASESTPRAALGRTCHFPSNLGSRSHAGWPSLGSGPKAMLNFGTSISRCSSYWVILSSSTILVGTSTLLVQGAHLSAQICFNCVTDRSEELGKRQRRGRQG